MTRGAFTRGKPAATLIFYPQGLWMNNVYKLRKGRVTLTNHFYRVCFKLANHQPYATTRAATAYKINRLCTHARPPSLAIPITWKYHSRKRNSNIQRSNNNHLPQIWHPQTLAKRLLRPLNPWWKRFNKPSPLYRCKSIKSKISNNRRQLPLLGLHLPPVAAALCRVGFIPRRLYAA